MGRGCIACADAAPAPAPSSALAISNEVLIPIPHSRSIDREKELHVKRTAMILHHLIGGRNITPSSTFASVVRLPEPERRPCALDGTTRPTDAYRARQEHSLHHFSIHNVGSDNFSSRRGSRGFRRGRKATSNHRTWSGARRLSGGCDARGFTRTSSARHAEQVLAYGLPLELKGP